MKPKNRNDSSINPLDITATAQPRADMLHMLCKNIGRSNTAWHNKRFQQVADRFIRTVGGAP